MSVVAAWVSGQDSIIMNGSSCAVSAPRLNSNQDSLIAHGTPGPFFRPSPFQHRPTVMLHLLRMVGLIEPLTKGPAVHCVAIRSLFPSLPPPFQDASVRLKKVIYATCRDLIVWRTVGDLNRDKNMLKTTWDAGVVAITAVSQYSIRGRFIASLTTVVCYPDWLRLPSKTGRG